MPKYDYTAEELADIEFPGYLTSASGTVSAPSPQAAKKAIRSALRSRGCEPTGNITVTQK